MLSIVGLVFLALAIIGVVLLITDLLFSTSAVIVVSAAIALLFAVFWFAQPLERRRERHEKAGSPGYPPSTLMIRRFERRPSNSV